MVSASQPIGPACYPHRVRVGEPRARHKPEPAKVRGAGSVMPGQDGGLALAHGSFSLSPHRGQLLLPIRAESGCAAAVSAGFAAAFRTTVLLFGRLEKHRFAGGGVCCGEASLSASPQGRHLLPEVPPLPLTRRYFPPTSSAQSASKSLRGRHPLAAGGCRLSLADPRPFPQAKSGAWSFIP